MHICKIVLAVFLTLPSVCGRTSVNEPNKIVVDVAKKRADISPSFVGVFFEEINRAGDGGLYAELVQNRSFEDNALPKGYSVKGNILVPPPVIDHFTGKVKHISDRKMRWNNSHIIGWKLLKQPTDPSSMRVVDERPYSPTAPHSLEISLCDSQQEVILENNGFHGMNIVKDKGYYLRSILRCSSDFSGTIEARIVGCNKNVLARTLLHPGTNGAWADTEKELLSCGSDAQSSLNIVFSGKGRVWLDYVSLFPKDTYKGRKNGLRPDLAQMIANLKPSFLRWPGGTIVGGITLSTRMNWKKMLGDPAKRPGEIVTWGYRCSYGLGYHEIMQYCEDIGSDFMYVCNMGLGDQYRMNDACPKDSIPYYIQDCLDAIEYAIGDPTTVWGARRAAAGHPEPFPLKYVELGNEHEGTEYHRRFPMFYQAIKAKYPHLQLICNEQHFDPKRATEQNTDLLDPHFYAKPEEFRRMNTCFNNHPRGRYKIYVGEYACNSGVGSGNMNAALSEAAFANGMERNSDLVVMTSFAPLLENVHNRRWPVNLIRFDASRAYGRSSYYVQKMLSEHRPDYNVWNNISNMQPDSTYTHFVSSGVDKDKGELIIKVVNCGKEPYSTNIELKGLKRTVKGGRIITLKAIDGTDENTFDEPKKIYPNEASFDDYGNDFSFVFAPYSYTVLRIPFE